MAFKTEFEFTLPRGYVDKDGNVHQKGVMRLATAKDEIVPLQDYRVQNNRAYLVLILLSRVISKLGDLNAINPNMNTNNNHNRCPDNSRTTAAATNAEQQKNKPK